MESRFFLRRLTRGLTRTGLLCDRALGVPGNSGRRVAKGLSLIPALVLFMAAAHPALGNSPSAPESLSAADFSRMVREMSEEGGYFHSDNFISNETSYLHVVDKLSELGARGGAYIGVGPEQNFTYIAKVRPQIAFIVDIRRQAIIEQLMYKAIFQLSPTRVEFLCRLFSRPMPPAGAARETLDGLLDYLARTDSDDKLYAANLAELRKTIQETFQFPLSDKDQSSLDYILKAFRGSGPQISFQMSGYGGGGWGHFPTLKELIVETDLHGKLGNFLASADDYNFVRDMQRKNLIIPIVGYFAGTKALAAVGDYLRKNNLTVTAFYTSNVEQYLFQNSVFSGFVANIRKLPITDRSLFIRAAPGRFAYSHPALRPGHRSVTLLEQISVFLKDFDAGSYQSYRDLLTTHDIAADSPR
jgi:hypothetical protein